MESPSLHADPPLRTASPPASWRVVLGTAAAYALIGGACLLLAGPPGYASPLYPSAGFALVAALVWGRAALPGVVLGAFVVNAVLGHLRGQDGLAIGLLPLVIGCGAALQAGVGASLLRRWVRQPLTLDEPRDITLAGALGAPVACLVSASVAVPALMLAGVVAGSAAAATWVTWWMGDALGVLIGAPIALTLIGQPRADWRPRRVTVGLPLLVALTLLAVAMLEFSRLEQQRRISSFERSADNLAVEVQERLTEPLHALRALHGAALVAGTLDRRSLRLASRWWLGDKKSLQAMGYSVRVPVAALQAFEDDARAQGLPSYRVFDRDGGRSRAADGEVVALRGVEPPLGNAAALGVNVLSIPATRQAVLASRASGQPAASAGFRLTQSLRDETGIVIYQALYDGPVDSEADRIARFAGVVFVTLRTEAALSGLPVPPGVRWCLLDLEPSAQRRLLAGDARCESTASATASYATARPLRLAGRSYALKVDAPDAVQPVAMRVGNWVLPLAGLTGSALLGALLLVVTGHSRRTELAVQTATAELRREVAERTQAERALGESEQRLRTIFENAPIGLMFLDPAGYILDVNPRLTQMLGRSAASLRGIPAAELAHPDERDRLLAQRRDLNGGSAVSVVDPLRVLHADGSEFAVRAGASAMRDDDGHVVRIVGVLEDITEHLRLQASENALNRAEAANRAKSDFLSRMSHELRTPLNAMIGFAQLLGMDRDPTPAAHHIEWARQIQRAGWHLLEMINETLDLARIESGAVPLATAALEIAPLVSASRALVQALATDSGVVIHERAPDDSLAVLGDPTRVQQVLTNLLSNAVKYNRPGGSVTVSWRRIESGSVEIVVADTGLGMTPEQQMALFQPYNRLGREGGTIEGTGIGLVISRRLAELMGGALDFSSRSGVGSTFRLRLPAAAVAAKALPAAVEAQPGPYRRRLVHYVEDNETNIEVMRGVLALRSQVVLETSTLGLDGITAIRRQRPDLVLLDMQLPDISGIELLRHLKNDPVTAEIPVIVVSADATPLQIQQALAAGAAHYVTKPLDLARFLRLVDSMLERAETRWEM